MRGFSVFCLGCRQPVRVPEQSTVVDDTPVEPRPPTPPPTSPPRTIEEPVIIPPKPAVIAPPVEVHRPVVTAVTPPKSALVRQPAARPPRRLILFGLIGLLVLLLIISAGFVYRWRILE